MRENIYKVVIDSLSAQVAILDEDGVIVETNRAWQDFGRKNDFTGPLDSSGLNYLAVCDQSGSSGCKEALAIAIGIRQVMAGKIEEFFAQYPCHSPSEKRWYAVRVVRYRSKKVKRVIVAHENITPLMLIQQTLEKKEQELQEQTERLAESNVALKVLLKHREEDKEKIEQTIVDNVNKLVMPYLEKLLSGRLSEREKTLAGIVKDHLQDVVSPFLSRLANVNRLLTPQEIQVAAFVREGMVSKDIAEVLGVSVSAIDFHRKSIRRKLGLSRTGENLRSYLLSLQ